MLTALRRIALTLVLCATTCALASPTPEYQVKAAFLFNFSQFVSWPAQAFSSPKAPIVIAVLGEDPFGSDLDSMVSGQHVDGHALLVRRYRDVSKVDGCHILFIDRSESAELPQILRTLQGRAILTVSDIDGSAESGVMIDLVTRNNHIRMHVNLAAARASGLTVSSQLLRLAQIIGPKGN
ncbi:MAG TPA: YfiR family protein [Steroidobacteraceae bacterium]|nr:YfiR family protein [Steroidobacteraceae bacterium]